MITQILAVNMDAESGNIIEITVFDGETSTNHRIPIVAVNMDCESGNIMETTVFDEKLTQTT